MLRKKGKPAFLPCKPSQVFPWPPPGPIPFPSPLAHQAPATTHFCAAQLTPSRAAFLFLPLHLQRPHPPCCSGLFQVLPSQKVLLPRSSSLSPFPRHLYFPRLGMPWAVTLVGWHPSGSLRVSPGRRTSCVLVPSLPLCLVLWPPVIHRSAHKCVSHEWMREQCVSHVNRSVLSPGQDSCLENPTDRGAWQAAVHGVAKSDKTEVSWHTLPVWRKQIKAREK